MILTNKTSKTQELILVDKYGEKYLTLLKAGCRTTLEDSLYSPEIAKLVQRGILATDYQPEPVVELEILPEELQAEAEADPVTKVDDIEYAPNEDGRYECPYCERNYASEANLKAHISKAHDEQAEI